MGEVSIKSDFALARISHNLHGLRGAVPPTGQKSRAARCRASGKRLDADRGGCENCGLGVRLAPIDDTLITQPSLVERLQIIHPDKHPNGFNIGVTPLRISL